MSTDIKNEVFGYQSVCDALLKGDYNNARGEHLKMQLTPSIFITLLRYFEKQELHHASNFHKEATNKEVNIALMFSNICKAILESKK